MTKMFQDAIDRARQWPDDRQDEAALLLLDLEAQRSARVGLSPEQAAEVERIREDVRSGRMALATDEQMAAFWKKCGL